MSRNLGTMTVIEFLQTVNISEPLVGAVLLPLVATDDCEERGEKSGAGPAFRKSPLQTLLSRILLAQARRSGGTALATSVGAGEEGQGRWRRWCCQTRADSRTELV